MDAPEVLREIYRRFTTGDFDGVEALCQPDCCFTVMPGNDHNRFAGVFQSPSEMMTRQKSIMADFVYDRFEPVDIFGSADKAAARVAVTLTSNRTGETIEAELAHLISLRDGKVAAYYEYYDTERFVRAGV